MNGPVEKHKKPDGTAAPGMSALGYCEWRQRDITCMRPACAAQLYEVDEEVESGGSTYTPAFGDCPVSTLPESVRKVTSRSDGCR